MNKNDASRLWLQSTVNRVAINRALEKIQSQGRALPCKVQSISGQIVTVTFDVISDTWALPPVSIPIASSVYDWIPVQVGDKGLTVPADVSIGQMSGLGSGAAVLGKNPANLSSLIFMPCANASWLPPGGDTGKRNIQGANGVFLQSVGGSVSAEFDKSAGITLTFGAVTLVINANAITGTIGSSTLNMTPTAASITSPTINLNGNVVIEGSLSSGGAGGASASFSGPITASGNIKAGNIDLETHVHPYSPGSGATTDTGAPTG